jgi:galactokinase
MGASHTRYRSSSGQREISTEYTKRTGIKATLFVSRPGQGATILKGG